MCRGFDPLLAKCITSSSHFNELPIFNLRQCLMHEANTVEDCLHLPGLDRGLQVQVWGTAEKRFDNKGCFSSSVIRTSLMSLCGHSKLSCDCGPALCGVNILTVHKSEFPSFIRRPSDVRGHQITIQQSEQWLQNYLYLYWFYIGCIGKPSPLTMLMDALLHILPKVNWSCVMDWIPLIIPGTALSSRSAHRRMRPQLLGHKFPEECLKSEPAAHRGWL